MVNHQTLVIAHNTNLVKSNAKQFGFDYCGISKADFLEAEAPRLESWLLANQHGKMGYMERNFDKRLDPRLLVDGAKSVVSLLFNYYPEEKFSDVGAKISTYAYGQDYHVIIKDKLYAFVEALKAEIGEINGRVFVDSAPILEKAWATKSGLGWIGKHTNLINKQQGSFFFIAELVLDLELEADGPIKDYCGTCTRCIDACPTDAITNAYWLDASRCISYFTIELKEEIPKEYASRLEGWAFGCDICQEVCPWNRFSKPTKESLLEPLTGLQQLQENGWRDLTAEVFIKVFSPQKSFSAVQRAGFEKLKNNISLALKSTTTNKN